VSSHCKLTISSVIRSEGEIQDEIVLRADAVSESTANGHSFRYVEKQEDGGKVFVTVKAEYLPPNPAHPITHPVPSLCRVSISRRGAVRADLLFCAGSTHKFIYSTSLIEFAAEVTTLHAAIHQSAEEGGILLLLSYTMELAGGISQHEMTFSLTP
jgi:uncharacterized beta-barrel protein YwiB (DUF1934 family)